jgi:glycosyltransferase involved in cell wall biosynthesis
LNILFLTKYYPPSVGGIERYSHLLCTGLVQRRHNVEVIAFSDENSEARTEIVDGVTVHRLKRHINLARAPLSLTLPARLRQATADCDVVHLNFPNPWMELMYLALHPQIPTVLSYHSDILRKHPFQRIYMPFAHRLFQRVSAVIASSPAYAASSELLTRFGHLCHTIPYPVDIDRMQAVQDGEIAAARKRHGRFVLFCGRLVHYKGIEYLVEAISQLNDVRLVIAGTGPEQAKCRQAIVSLGLEDRVDLVGKIDDDELKALYHACECFVLPSISRAESFGIVLAEAMACGRPVISTDIGSGTSHINIDGETGYVVPPRDAKALAAAIARVVGDVDIQRQLGSSARRRAETSFGTDTILDQTIQLYDEIVADDRQTGASARSLG